MQSKFLFILFCSLVMMLACSPKTAVVMKKDSPEKNVKMNKLSAYKDGNNNVWEIEYAAIHYKPVARSESSSGVY